MLRPSCLESKHVTNIEFLTHWIYLLGYYAAHHFLGQKATNVSREESNCLEHYYMEFGIKSFLRQGAG